MAERELPVINKLGLHARAASKFVQTASHYSADIRVTKGEREVSGKSIMGVMMLAAAQGGSIHVAAHGGDAEAALDALDTLMADRFGEAE